MSRRGTDFNAPRAKNAPGLLPELLIPAFGSAGFLPERMGAARDRVVIFAVAFSHRTRRAVRPTVRADGFHAFDDFVPRQSIGAALELVEHRLRRLRVRLTETCPSPCLEGTSPSARGRGGCPQLSAHRYH